MRALNESFTAPPKYVEVCPIIINRHFLLDLNHLKTLNLLLYQGHTNMTMQPDILESTEARASETYTVWKTPFDSLRSNSKCACVCMDPEPASSHWFHF